MSFWPEFDRLRAAGEPFCCVTLVDGVGSVPQDRGAKMLVTGSALTGTIGGGRVENHVAQHARKMLSGEGEPTQFIQWNLQTDLGMTCGGVVRLFFEVFNQTRWRIAIFGAGHVCQSLTRVLTPLDCQLTVFDTRPEWLAKLPEAGNLRRVHAEDLPAQVATLPEGTFVLVMTMGHTTDLPILREVMPRNFPYVGVIGSKAKASNLRRTLFKEGFAEAAVNGFHSPMGLAIGTNHLQEIAISIAAELIGERDGLSVGE